ncbi:hypothetical protein ACH5RR_036248 [Cinchona calisaya]|uniref:Uncharacterized protein n=1 Tax=Cinchona calisaya TaxID=153742 RepID=A0ABD2Y7C7_9GENT
MEFSSILYFSFWSLISLVFSTTGIYAFRKAAAPVSELVEGDFEIVIVQLVCCSTSYAFLFRPAFEQDDQRTLSNKIIFLSFYNNFVTVYLSIDNLVSSASLSILKHKWTAVCWLLFSAAFTILVVVNSVTMGLKYSQATGSLLTGFAGPLIMYPYHTLCWILLQGFSLSFLGNGYPFLWDSFLKLMFFTVSLPSCWILFASLFKKRITTSTVAARAYENRKIFELVFGTLGTTLAQYYFRVQSVPLMLGFISWAVAWLGILANVQPCTDFGIFQFLVTSSLHCAVSLFGLHFHTFVIVFGGIVLMVLRWKMESVKLMHFGIQESVVKDWSSLEVWNSAGNFNDSRNQTPHLELPRQRESSTQRLGIQRRLTQPFEWLWAPYASFGG